MYRWIIGHALWSPALLDEQTDEIERALWVAVRSLEERGACGTRA